MRKTTPGFAPILILIIMVLVGTLGASYYLKTQRDQTYPPKATLTPSYTTKPAIGELKGICEENNGKWLEDYNECEGIEEDVCSANGGKYNSCDSPCRHDPEAGMCIQVCVRVCKF